MIIILYKQLRHGGAEYSFQPFGERTIHERKLEIDITEKEFNSICDISEGSLKILYNLLARIHHQKVAADAAIKNREQFEEEVNKIKAQFKEENRHE